MIIIVDGIDGSGKTTLIHNLIKILRQRGAHVHYCHHVAPDKNGLFEGRYSAFTYFYKSLFSAEKAIKNNEHNEQYVIFDRFWQSNLTYGKYFENQYELKQHELSQLLIKLQSFNWCWIYTGVSKDYLKKTYSRRRINKDIFNDIADYLNMNNLYDKLFNVYKKYPNLSLGVIDLTFITQDDYSNILIKIVNAIQNIYVKNNGANKILINDSYESVGNTQGAIAIIGDSVNQNNNAGYKDPFIGGCGKIFHKFLLTDFNVEHFTNTYITNAFKLNGNIINKDELKNFPVIVALGKNVQKIISEFNFTNKIVYGVSHPAYIKRFYYDKFFNYYAQVFEIIKKQAGKYVEFNQFEEFVNLSKED